MGPGDLDLPPQPQLWLSSGLAWLAQFQVPPPQPRLRLKAHLTWPAWLPALPPQPVLWLNACLAQPTRLPAQPSSILARLARLSAPPLQPHKRDLAAFAWPTEGRPGPASLNTWMGPLKLPSPLNLQQHQSVGPSHQGQASPLR